MFDPETSTVAGEEEDEKMNARVHPSHNHPNLPPSKRRGHTMASIAGAFASILLLIEHSLHLAMDRDWSNALLRAQCLLVQY